MLSDADSQSKHNGCRTMLAKQNLPQAPSMRSMRLLEPQLVAHRHQFRGLVH